LVEFISQDEGRYDRHHLISWWDQDKLAEASVIVIGAGALGNEVIKLLALLGIGHILVVDFDVVSRSNLTRMVLFREGDVGKSKVEVAVQRARELNPEIEIRGIHGDLRIDVGLGEFRAADLVIGGLDSVHARWALNRKCMLAGTPWIDGGISDFHGHVARYDPHAGACYECTFTDATYERFDRRYSCPYGLVERFAETKVPTTAITTSIIASLQIQEALFILNDVENAGLNPGERLSIYLKPYRLFVDELPQNPDCMAHSTISSDIPKLSKKWREQPIHQMMNETELGETKVNTLKLPFEIVHRFYCPECDEGESVMKPKEKVFHDEAICPRCHTMRQVETIGEIDLDSELAGLSLAELYIPEREILAFAADHHGSELFIYRELAEDF
jgi:molybdopterin/thiamine biosynthesis adenylyltransferase